MKNKWISYSLLLLLLMFGAFYMYGTLRSPRKPKTPTPEYVQPNPPFTHEANLVIGRGKDTLKTLEIEIVDDEYGITRGLMFRKKMEENRGMLFIFPDVQMRSFWMRNTIIPLDIIFVGEDQRIVTIQHNTKPFSETSIPSSAPAKYVLEVNAGLAERYGLQIGDRLDWTLLN